MPLSVLAPLPFRPRYVFTDGQFVLIAGENRIAVLDRRSKKPKFETLDSIELPGKAGASVAVRGDRIFVALRQARVIAIYDFKGRETRRFAVPLPPNALAVDDLGAVYVFGVLAEKDAGDSLLDVYDSAGTRTRRAGAVPNYRKDGAVEQRNDVFPLLRTDSSGVIWALLRDGKAMIRVGASQAGDDFLDLSAFDGSQSAPDEKAEKAAEEEREAVRKKLVAYLQEQGVDPSDPKARVVTFKNSPWRYRHFACKHRECVLLPSTQSSKAIVTRVDLDKHVEVQTVLLERQPEEMIGVGLVRGSFVVYGILDNQLIEFELPD